MSENKPTKSIEHIRKVASTMDIDYDHKTHEFTQYSNDRFLLQELLMHYQQALDKIKELENDLKMCREIGVEMQREVNRALSKENEALKAECERLKKELEERQVCPACGEEVDYKDKIRMSHDIRIYESKISLLEQDLESEKRSHQISNDSSNEYITELKQQNEELIEALESARCCVSTYRMQTYSRAASRELAKIDELLAEFKDGEVKE